MIHLQGEALTKEIDETELQQGELAFWWLGQHSFIVKLAGQVLYLDPFLTDMPERRVPPLVDPNQVRHANMIFGSHDHGDHIDRPAWPTLAKASPQASFVVPELLRARISAELGIAPNRIIGLDDGMVREINGIRVTGVAAAHELLDRDAESGLYPYLGFVIEADGLRIYHAGDTCRYEGLLGKLLSQVIDVAFLPINGRDARRFQNNIAGNMTYQEAVDLAGELAPRLVVPTHFDMFDGNLGEPDEFRAYLKAKFPQLNAWLGGYGERVLVRTDPCRFDNAGIRRS